MAPSIRGGGVSESLTVLPAERRRTGSAGRRCVWRPASFQAFEAWERSEQITVPVVSRHRSDLQPQSDGRAAGSEIKPRRAAPPGQTEEGCFEPKQRAVHAVDGSAFIWAGVEQKLTLEGDFWRKPQPD